MAAKCLYRHCTIERERAVTTENFDQLSTYIYVYVDDYQNNIYFEQNKKIVRTKQNKSNNFAKSL